MAMVVVGGGGGHAFVLLLRGHLTWADLWGCLLSVRKEMGCDSVDYSLW